MQVGERGADENVHPPQQMIPRNPIPEPELIEKLALIAPLPPYHRCVLRRRSTLWQRNHRSADLSSPFSTASSGSVSFTSFVARLAEAMSALPRTSQSLADPGGSRSNDRESELSCRLIIVRHSYGRPRRARRSATGPTGPLRGVSRAAPPTASSPVLDRRPPPTWNRWQPKCSPPVSLHGSVRHALASANIVAELTSSLGTVLGWPVSLSRPLNMGTAQR